MIDTPCKGVYRFFHFLLIRTSAFILALIIGWTIGHGRLQAAPSTPGQTPVNRTSVQNPEQLARLSDLIVYGHLSERTVALPTGNHEGDRKVFHYVQSIRVIEVWKGPNLKTVNLLTSGVEPLPDASDPLNRTYTGPLESGDYIIFLRRSGDYYTLTGIWQGLYPVYEGKSVALLHNGGFTSLDSLSVSLFKSKVKRLAE